MAKIDPKKSLVVGTIRMGFGHHRIAYAMSSWGLQQPGLDVYFHDLLSIDSQEAGLIRETDAMYRASSKLATEYGGPFEWFHGMLTSSGDATSMRSTALIGARLAPLMKGLPPDVPVIASHSLVALAAAVAGSKTILNLVIDNHPQWFVITPKAHNLVQGPRNYIGLSKMLGGVKDATTLTLAGHWIPQDLVVNAEADAAWRSSRASTPSAPLTILIPVGGAGAQRTFITSLIKELAPLVEAGRVRLVVNAGDHADMKEALLESLSAIAGEVNVISNIAEARGLAKNLRAWAPGNEDAMPLLNLMAFTDYFAAVAATDILTRAVDVLACKPSELAFYPVPKLMIRRVGDHEAHSASRANELGDGTAEARTVADALEYTKLFLASEPLQTMNAAISVNARAGVYDGCKNALGHAQIA
ncbi:hypothetical protein M885DRAFT_431047 [Pelagophyceae sp. CCMP2097]|nr:hypothetical protein M885DRAFT_431047 [Pelagophyceae sp. CCMP2097]